MSTFSETSWAQPAYAAEYLDHAAHYIPEREQLFEILQSFYRRFLGPRGALKACDLGCGDGVLSGKLQDLESAGFTNADCHYKNGLFTIYTARHA